MCVACSVQNFGALGLAPYALVTAPLTLAAAAKTVNSVAEKTNINVKVTEEKVDYFQRNIFNFFIVFLGILVFLPIIAPIAASFGLYWISEPIYFIYSFMCHQFHWRSIHINGHQVAWCTRDTFIWGAFFATALALKYNFFKTGLKWYWIFPFIIPIALDGGIQTIATIFGFGSGDQFYLSTNMMRMITGTIFGIGLGLIMASYIKEEQDRLNNY